MVLPWRAQEPSCLRMQPPAHTVPTRSHHPSNVWPRAHHLAHMHPHPTTYFCTTKAPFRNMLYARITLSICSAHYRPLHKLSTRSTAPFRHELRTHCPVHTHAHTSSRIYTHTHTLLQTSRVRSAKRSRSASLRGNQGISFSVPRTTTDLQISFRPGTAASTAVLSPGTSTKKS